MKKQFYMRFLILLSVLSQGIGNSSEENISESSKILVRKKRIIDDRSGKHQPVPIENFRHMANVERNRVNVCGGAIILAYLIITAAHCVIQYPGATYTVRTGSAHVKQGLLHKVNRKIEKDDLALLIISPDIDFVHSPSRPIQLTTYQMLRGTPATISGWGCMRGNCLLGCLGRSWIYPDELRSIPVRLCMCHYTFSSKYICTEDVNRKVRVRCGSGDEGGAVVARGHLIGIHVQASIPDVHVNVFHPEYLNWINEIKANISTNPYISYDLNNPHNPHLPEHSNYSTNTQFPHSPQSPPSPEFPYMQHNPTIPMLRSNCTS